MRIKRYKSVRKYTQYYKLNYNIAPPYKVVLDHMFVQAALEGKIQLRDQLPKLLQAQTELCTTPCIMEEIRKGGRHFNGARQIAGSFRYLKCMHKKKYMPVERCIERLVDNKNSAQIIIGAQHQPVRKLIRSKPGVPMLSIHGNRPYMEAPSEKSKSTTLEDTSKKAALTEEELKIIQMIDPSKKPKEEGEAPEEPIFKRKKVKGPNPLSMKKKKTSMKSSSSNNINTIEEKKGKGVKRKAVDDDVEENTAVVTKKRKRNRNRKKPVITTTNNEDTGDNGDTNGEELA